MATEASPVSVGDVPLPGRRWRSVRAAHVFVAGEVVAGAAILVVLARRTPWPPPTIRGHWGTYAALAVLVVLCESLISLTQLRRSSLQPAGPVVRRNPSTGANIAVVALFGPLVGVATATAATAVDMCIRGPRPLKRAHNIGQIPIYTGGAAAVAWWLGWPIADGQVDLADIGIFTVVAVVQLVGNLACLFAFHLVLAGRDSVRNTARGVIDGLRGEVTTVILGPLLLVAALADPLYVPLLMVPLMGVLFVGGPDKTYDVTGLFDQINGELRIGEMLVDAPGGGVLVVGPDRSDELGERLGSDVSDRLATLIAARLRHGFDDVAVFARAGADGLLLFSPTAVTAADVDALARRVVRAMGEPFTLASLTFSLSGIAGAAVATPTTPVSEVVRRAQVARRVARELGRDVEVYDEARMTPDAFRLELVEDLRRAITSGAIDLHYQPIADTSRRRITGMEALLRWHHPNHGPMDAATTVRLAEPSPLLASLTTLVLDRAVAACVQWRQTPEYASYTVAVNISPRSLLDPDLPTVVADVLAGHGLLPAALTLEVTESALVVRGDETRAGLERLAAVGVVLSVDDLSGLAAFSELVDAPISEVKIDRRSITPMLERPGDAAAVWAIVGFANKVGIRVVAEGVEDDATWYRLDEYGCDAVQGHALAPPMPLDQLHTWLSENHYRHHGPHRAAPFGDVVPLTARRPG